MSAATPLGNAYAVGVLMRRAMDARQLELQAREDGDSGAAAEQRTRYERLMADAVPYIADAIGAEAVAKAAREL